MKAYCLLNHNLTENQKAELKEKYNVSSILYPSEELSAGWSQIPATETLSKDIIANVCRWLKDAEKNDVLIIQGEAGHSFLITDYALKHNIIPLHAVTKRVAKEDVNGEIIQRQYVFQHVCFREYKYFEYNCL